MGTVSTLNGNERMAASAPLERKTQCYIATLLNREVDRLWRQVETALKAEGELDTKVMMAAALSYHQARGERDAFCKWMEGQEAEE